MGREISNWDAYKLRLKRRRLLWRALRARHGLSVSADRTGAIEPGEILAFACLRNEAARLPYFLDHHRRMGVRHFLIVDNGSTDDSVALLAGQDDVSLWSTDQSYRAARFGVDWLGWLLMKYGHGHWCLTLDADELFAYPHMDSRPLPDLTHFLDGQGVGAMGALMLDLFPKGHIEDQSYRPGQDPTEVLRYFDAHGYWAQRQHPLGNLWLQGGPRARMFFAQTPERAPTLNKIPLIRWSRRFAYVNSTHSALPRGLNACVSDAAVTGVLLHTKFLPSLAARSAEEKQRREHFGDPGQFDAYYDRLIDNPDLWRPEAVEYAGWAQLEALGLMSRGGWV